MCVGTSEGCKLHGFWSNLREGCAPGCDGWPSNVEQCSHADTEMRREPHRAGAGGRGAPRVDAHGAQALMRQRSRALNNNRACPERVHTRAGAHRRYPHSTLPRDILCAGGVDETASVPRLCGSYSATSPHRMPEFIIGFSLLSAPSPFALCTLHFHFHFVLGFSLPGKLDGFSQWLRRPVTTHDIDERSHSHFPILSAVISIPN